MFCVNCGKEIKENWKFCVNCGFDLSGITGKKEPIKEEKIDYDLWEPSDDDFEQETE